MRIGTQLLPSNVIAAPMAGVTDMPFRRLCSRLGAGLAVSEMIAASPRLWHTKKSSLRRQHAQETAPRAVQIAGADPGQLARAARFNVDEGADIIDINMGCPAKKVCRVAAGSALLADEALVGRILDAVVAAVDVPVTLKMRTGPSPASRNAVAVAVIAQAAGISALTIHGRTRACVFRGRAEYGTIRAVKSAVHIPVIANGDIDSPERAAAVLRETGADGVMIGRAAQGNPWIFREVVHFLQTGQHLPPPPAEEVHDTLLEHLDALHAFYGERAGVRIARKHLAWYLKPRPGGEACWRQLSRVDDAREQRRLLAMFLAGCAAPAVESAA
jgi:tRNA-dihydrouridine synthase B